MTPINFYVGWDSSQSTASFKAWRSIAKHVAPQIGIFKIHFVALNQLGNKYWRKHDGTESTEFTYSRFLVPHLSGYEGYSVFCDCDFMWRKDPMELLDYINGDPVRVVKHDITPEQLSATKMNGKVQKWYPRKNWSSMMLFNNAHPDCRKLTPEAVSTMPASWLHGFEWTNIDATEGLPRKFNHLVGYYDDPDPVAVHFTDGGPWLPGYENVEFATEWRNV